MSTYQELRGLKVKYLAANPDPGTAGDVWYDSATFELKGFVGRAAWSAGALVSTGRNALAGFGTQTAGVIVCGEKGPPGVINDDTEEYNGSGWSTGEDYPATVHQIAGTGTQTAGLVAGGIAPGGSSNLTFEYDGTDYGAGGNLGAAKQQGGMCGTQTAGLHCGGDNPTPGYIVDSEEYDGSSWTEGSNLPVAKRHHAMGGIQTAAIASGGRTAGGSVATSETYDGTNWTSAPSMNTARRYLKGFGLQTSAVSCGGSPNGSADAALTEQFDGTSWSEIADLATARNLGGTSQNSSAPAGWYAGGNSGGSPFDITEEFNNTFDVVTQGAWGSGGNLTTTRRSFMGGAGTLTAGMIAGGYIGPFSNATEEYDGSAWANGGNYPASLYYVSIGGTQTASLFAGGNDGDNLGVSEAFTYDGTNFTDIADLPDNRGSGCINGGSQTAAVMASGLGGSAPQSLTTTTDEWNGSAWGAGGTCLVATQASGNANSPSGSDHLTFGGYSGGLIATSFSYDGTSWFTSQSLPAATQQHAGFGTPTAAVSAGGTTGSAVNTTVEFAGATTAETGSTIDFD